MTIDEVLSRLQDVTPDGANEWKARCPCSGNHAHGDKNRSFSVKHDTGTGKILLHCYKGCSLDEICEAIGCRAGDLMPNADRRDNFLTWYAGQNGMILETVYSYCYGKYSDGLAKVRFRKADGKKDFRWIKEDPGKKSGYSMTHEGCPHRLYIAGNHDADLFFIVEGEKDADTMHRLTGCTAASVENGASLSRSRGDKWRDEYTQQLEGKTVFILWDNDEAGRTFAEVEAQALAGHAAHIFMLDIATAWTECPEKGDISDMAATLGVEKAVKVISDMMQNPIERLQTAETPADGIEQGEGQNIPQEPPQPPKTPLQLFDEFIGKVQTEAYKPMQTGMPAFDKLLGGGILKQSLLILSAAPGTGKTTLAQQIFETAAADGTDVIFLNLEMSREQLLARSLSRIAKRQMHRMTAADILKGYTWTDQQRSVVLEAADEYRRRIAPRMQYNPEGCGTDIDSIVKTLDAAGEAAKQAGKPAPVVVLDYLHLITTTTREDQSEIIKKAVARLKDYAIRYDSYVFAISANNRAANASGVISQSSGRDTSAIEYSADYQLSLNYRAFLTKEEITIAYTDETGRTHTKQEKADASNPDHLEALMKQDPRNMYVQVLKNRMNAPGGKLFLSFDAANSVFYPVDKSRDDGNSYPQFTELEESDPDNPWL